MFLKIAENSQDIWATFEQYFSPGTFKNHPIWPYLGGLKMNV